METCLYGECAEPAIELVEVMDSTLFGGELRITSEVFEVCHRHAEATVRELPGMAKIVQMADALPLAKEN